MLLPWRANLVLQALSGQRKPVYPDAEFAETKQKIYLPILKGCDRRYRVNVDIVYIGQFGYLTVMWSSYDTTAFGPVPIHEVDRRFFSSTPKTRPIPSLDASPLFIPCVPPPDCRPPYLNLFLASTSGRLRWLRSWRCSLWSLSSRRCSEPTSKTARYL